jgi:hypothetical protein
MVISSTFGRGAVVGGCLSAVQAARTSNPAAAIRFTHRIIPERMSLHR